MPLTDDFDAFDAGLRGLGADGGGDTPEAVYTGIVTALGADWSRSASRSLIVLGDAPAHDPEAVTGLTAAAVTDIAKGIAPMPELPPTVGGSDIAARGESEPSEPAGSPTTAETTAAPGQEQEPSEPAARAADAAPLVAAGETVPPVAVYALSANADLTAQLAPIATAPAGSPYRWNHPTTSPTASSTPSRTLPRHPPRDSARPGSGHGLRAVRLRDRVGHTPLGDRSRSCRQRPGLGIRHVLILRLTSIRQGTTCRHPRRSAARRARQDHRRLAVRRRCGHRVHRTGAGRAARPTCRAGACHVAVHDRPAARGCPACAVGGAGPGRRGGLPPVHSHGSRLRHAAWRGLRGDRDPAEVTAPDPTLGRTPDRASREGISMVAEQRVTVQVGERRLVLTNLDKTLYPEDGFSKGEVIINRTSAVLFEAAVGGISSWRDLQTPTIW